MKISICILALLLTSSLAFSQGYAADDDSNPPGPAGGVGTNWENPPGSVGGPGASPDTLEERAEVDTRWEEKVDKDNDGVVEAGEIHRWREKHQEKLSEKTEVDIKWEEKADIDGDGVVEKGEAYKWKSAHPKKTTAEQAVVDTRWEERADRDNDGVVERGEAHRWKSTHPKKHNNPPGPVGGPGASPRR